MSELERVRAENHELREQIAVLRQQMDWLKKQLFGRKSERGLPEGQGELGLELEEEGGKEVPPPPAKEVASSRTGKKRVTRAQRLPDHLPVREEVMVPPAVQAQPEAWRCLGEEVTETLEKEPGYVYVRRVIRPKFVNIELPHEPPVTAPAPPALIPGGFYGPSLLADLVLDKYLDHLPLYRIEQRFWRLHGVNVPRQSLSDALAQIAALATPVVQAMEQTLWAGGYIQADEPSGARQPA